MKCGQARAEPVDTTLIKIYAGERLRILPEELKLSPELMPLYDRYARAIDKIIVYEGKWRARLDGPGASPVASIGAQIDLANNRAAAWEDVLDAVKPLYARLDKDQQAVANKRLVVSLEPSAWTLPRDPLSAPPARAESGQLFGMPPTR